jgi:hypothetical protein
MLPGASTLPLNSDGLETKTLFRRNRSYWIGVTGFTVIAVPKRMVVYDDDRIRHRKIAKANMSLFGRNTGLPNTYGLSAENLDLLMTRWRDRAMTRG